MKFDGVHLTLGISIFGDHFLFNNRMFASLEEASIAALEETTINSYQAFEVAKTSIDPTFYTKSTKDKERAYVAFTWGLKTLDQNLRTYKANQASIFEEFDVLTSAKVAKSVIERHQPHKEVVEVLEFLRNPSEITAALDIAHEKLRTKYEEAIKIWAMEKASLSEDAWETEVKDRNMDFKIAVATSMSQGLAAARQTSDIASALLTSESTENIEALSDDLATGKIEKKRSWKEIVGDSEDSKLK